MIIPPDPRPRIIELFIEASLPLENAFRFESLHKDWRCALAR